MENPLVRIDPGLLLWTVLTFLALLVVLRWKAWGPIVGAIERREKSIRDAIDAARKEREEAQALLEDNRRLLDETRREAAALVDQGRRDAEKIRSELLEKAGREAAEAVEQGRRQIEREGRLAVQQLRTEAASLAVLAAGRVVQSTLDEATRKRLLDEALREISDLPRS